MHGVDIAMRTFHHRHAFHDRTVTVSHEQVLLLLSVYLEPVFVLFVENIVV